jgi:UDP-N-acetylmuramate--alanine ligase
MADSSQIQAVRAMFASLAPIHFIGIGGSGMAPLACFARGIIDEVTGSDASESSLKKLRPFFGDTGLQVGQFDSKLIQSAKTVVISSAIKADNQELLVARKSHKKILHRSEFISLLAKHFYLITVAGTHGKSTTSALVAYGLHAIGLDPSFIVGAGFKRKGSDELRAFRVGQGPHLVVEADESDGSFLRYEPDIAVVTNIDADHLDYYKDVDDIEQAFHRHAQNIKPEGWLICHWDHPRCRQLPVPELRFRLAYGEVLGSEIRLLQSSIQGGNPTIDVIVEYDRLQGVIQLFGKHNAFNFLAALSVARALNLDIKSFFQHLSSFRGLERRMQCYFDSPKLTIFDDYAHNPIKIESCLKGLCTAYPKHYILAVFQPHRYSRISSLYHDFTTAFTAANEVCVLPVFAAGEPKIEGFEPESVANDIQRNSGVAMFYAPDLATATDNLKNRIRNLQREGHSVVLMTLGAGDVNQITSTLADWAKSQ